MLAVYYININRPSGFNLNSQNHLNQKQGGGFIMGNLPVGSRSLYKGKKRSAGMNELRHPGSTQMTRTGQAHRGGEHRLNTGPPDWQTVE